MSTASEQEKQCCAVEYDMVDMFPNIPKPVVLEAIQYCILDLNKVGTRPGPAGTWLSPRYVRHKTGLVLLPVDFSGTPQLIVS